MSDASADGRAPLATDGASSLSCAEAQRMIDVWIESDDLKDTERLLLKIHLKSCPACSTLYEEKRRIALRIRQTLSIVDTPSGFTDQVLERLSAWQKRNSPFASKTRSQLEIESLAQNLAAGKSGSHTPQLVRRSRRWLIPTLLLAGFMLAALACWLPFKRKPQSKDRLGSIEGTGTVLRLGREYALQSMKYLLPGDELRADVRQESDPLTITISGINRIGLTLLPGTRLRWGKNNCFLERGTLRCDMLYSASESSFGVETEIGAVLVQGTTFAVQVTQMPITKVTVAVSEGSVRLLRAGSFSSLKEGELITFDETGHNSKPLSLSPERWNQLLSGKSTLHSIAAVPAPVPNKRPALNRGEPEKFARIEQTAEPPVADWQMYLGNLDFRRLTMPDALRVLAEALPSGTQRSICLELSVQARRLGAQNIPSRLSIKRPMPTASILRWLARENDLRITFDTRPRLRKAELGEPLGEPQCGALPVRHFDPDHAIDSIEFEGVDDLNELLSRLAFYTAENIYFPRASVKLPMLSRQQRFRTIEHLLQEQLANTPYDYAYYDEALLFERREVIEALTVTRRVISVERFVDRPLHPEWAFACTNLFSNLLWDNGRLALADRMQHGDPLLRNVSISALDSTVEFTSGIVRERKLRSELERWGSSSFATVAPLSGLREYRLGPGVVRDLNELLQLAREHHLAIDGANFEAKFPKQSFVHRSLSLGAALEWALRLQGLGLQQRDGHWTLCSERELRNRAAIQVVSLGTLTQRFGHHEQLPQQFARVLQRCYPVWFGERPLYPVKDRIIFYGDDRHLAIAQRVLLELIRAFEQAKEQPLDPEKWLPSWYVSFAQALNEPFQGAPSGFIPAGTFAGILRQQGLFAQFPKSILVSPEAMQLASGTIIETLNVNDLTTREVIERLGAQVRLVPVFEEDVVWYRPETDLRKGFEE